MPLEITVVAVGVGVDEVQTPAGKLRRLILVDRAERRRAARRPASGADRTGAPAASAERERTPVVKRSDLLTGTAACERLFNAVMPPENVTQKDLDRLRLAWKRNQDVFIARELRRRARRAL